MDSGVICPGCDQKSNGEFCMHCGEIIKHQRLSLRTLINSVPDVFFDVESGLFYSILNLLKRPGTVVRRYFAGDRSRNYKPLKFVLFIGGLWALLYFRFHIQGDSSSFYEQIFNDAKTGRNTGKNLDEFNDQYTSLFLLLQFPIIAFMTWIVFHKRKYFYGEHLVANAYFIAEVSLYKIVLFPLYYLLNGTHWINTLDLFYSLWILCYYSYAFYDWLYYRKTIRGFFISVAMVVCLILLILIITIIMVPVVYYIKVRFFGVE